MPTTPDRQTQPGMQGTLAFARWQSAGLPQQQRQSLVVQCRFQTPPYRAAAEMFPASVWGHARVCWGVPLAQPQMLLVLLLRLRKVGLLSLAPVLSIPLDLLSWILGAGLRNQGNLAWQDQQCFSDSYSIRCALMQLSLPLDTLANRLLQLELV